MYYVYIISINKCTYFKILYMYSYIPYINI